MKIENCLKQRSNGTEVHVYIQPRASQPGIMGLFGNLLKIRVTSPPSEGKANAELQRLLAKHFQVAIRDVQMIVGHTSRQKRVIIKGKTWQEIRDSLSDLSCFQSLPNQ